MGLSLKETQSISKIAQHLYDYLPGQPHPYADQSISFIGASRKIGLEAYWPRGSKLPAITKLLNLTLDTQPNKFCPLLLEIVSRGMTYRANKANPISYQEILELNKLIQEVGFKIPELWDQSFLDTLPGRSTTEAPDHSTTEEFKVDPSILKELSDQLLLLNVMEAHERGYAFERFLQELFRVFGLNPRAPFRLRGEQIDGSFLLDSETYLVEAKWQKELVSQNGLLIFNSKVAGNATWARGLFVSYGDFSEDGLSAFRMKGPTNIIGMTGQDLWCILSGETTLQDAIRLKARRAAETGDFFVPVFALCRS